MLARRIVRLAPCAALLASLAPRIAHADEPVAPDTHDPAVYPPESARLNLVIGGAATFAVWYMGAFGAATLFPDAPGAKQLKYPLVGPWMAFTETGCSKRDPNCSTLTIVLREVLTGIDGVGQAGGFLVMALEAPFLTTQAPARASGRPRPLQLATWEPGPILVSSKGAWFSVVGRF
jgi:hypothetical protein